MTENGIELLTGGCAEVPGPAAVMEQISALARLNDNKRVWLQDVAVSDSIVKLGLNPEGEGRICILRPLTGP